MYCSRCGKNNSDEARFCSGCGCEFINVRQIVSQNADDKNNAVNVIAFAFTVISVAVFIITVTAERMSRNDMIGALAVSAIIAIVSLAMIVSLKKRKKCINAFGWLSLVFDVLITVIFLCTLVF